MSFIILIIDYKRVINSQKEEIKHYKKLSTIDPLTQVGNRRLMSARLDEEIARSMRFNKPFCLALVDIDDFKIINEQLGHAEADNILASVANEIKQGVRIVDQVYRFGGDEFVVIMPVTKSANALEVMKRIDKLISSKVSFTNCNISVSIGIVEFPNPYFDLSVRSDMSLISSDIIGQASDALLNQAKAGVGISVFGN